MVRYHIDDVSDDMVLGQSISLPSGKLLLGAGYRVSKRYRERLKDLGFHSVLVEEEGTGDVTPAPVVNEADQAALQSALGESTRKMEQIVAKFREESQYDMHAKLFHHRKDLNRHIMSPAMVRQLDTIIEQIMSQPQVVMNMAVLKETSGAFYERAVNVTITALCIGKCHHLSYDEIKQLATGALNYHVGLVAIPQTLVNKEDVLTDEEKALYRQHTIYGYLLLSQNTQISPTSAIVALQHHEKQNGTGYPLGLKGDNAPPVKDIKKTHMIHRFSEIVSVADTYHAFLDAECGNSDYETDVIRNAIKNVISLSGHTLNKEIVRTLVSIVPVYPVGTRVRLTEAPTAKLKQYIGVVAKDNPGDIHRPVILLYRTNRGQAVTPPVLVDTAKNENIQFELLP